MSVAKGPKAARLASIKTNRRREGVPLPPVNSVKDIRFPAKLRAGPLVEGYNPQS
jgi:hypothetical protein